MTFDAYFFGLLLLVLAALIPLAWFGAMSAGSADALQPNRPPPPP